MIGVSGFKSPGRHKSSGINLRLLSIVHPDKVVVRNKMEEERKLCVAP